MPMKPRPVMWYPIANGGNETGDAVKATCQSTANQKIARYQRRFGSRYYLMFPVPFDGNEYRYVEVERDPINSPNAGAKKSAMHHASAASMACQARAQRHSGGE